MTDVTTAGTPPAAPAPESTERREAIGRALRNPLLGPLAALVVATVIFTVTTDTFATPGTPR